MEPSILHLLDVNTLETDNKFMNIHKTQSMRNRIYQERKNLKGFVVPLNSDVLASLLIFERSNSMSLVILDIKNQSIKNHMTQNLIDYVGIIKLG